MPTGQTIITNALTILGINEQGGTPSASDSTDALAELNSMWEAWGIDEGLIYSILSAQYPLTANVGKYTIGTGATFSAARPQRIYKSFVVNAVTLAAGTTSTSPTITLASTTGVLVGQTVSGTGIPVGSVVIAVVTNTSATISANATATGSPTLTFTGGNRNELKIVEAGQYYSHNDLGALASTPEELYPDFNDDSSGFATLYLWPIPTVVSPARLELETAVTFSAWTLGGAYNIPYGYQDAIQYALAWRCISRFGMIVDQGTQQRVAEIGSKAEMRIRAANGVNRMQPMESMMAPGTPPPKAA